MPTNLPRHTLTETAEVAAVLDRAALRYPGLSRQQVLRRLVLEAGDVQEQCAEAERARYRRLLADPPACLVIGGDGAAEVRRARDEDWA